LYESNFELKWNKIIYDKNGAKHIHYNKSPAHFYNYNAYLSNIFIIQLYVKKIVKLIY